MNRSALKRMTLEINGQKYCGCVAVVRQTDSQGRPKLVEIVHGKHDPIDVENQTVECITLYTPCRNLEGRSRDAGLTR